MTEATAGVHRGTRECGGVASGGAVKTPLYKIKETT
jgi:hypothetical protein